MSEVAKRLKVSHENGQSDEDDDQYFKSYGFLQCHQTMVSDYARTDAYRHAILKSYEKLYKKVVLEVGCGTGILSIFACQAGASRVFAVEASDSIRYAERVIDGNGYKDKICLVRSKIEDFKMPSEEKVDAIISEWMGYTLLCEWMLPSVISTRDRLLKEGGLMFPNKASMFMALATETKYLKERAEYWRNRPMEEYKVNMDALMEEEYKAVIGKMIVHEVVPTEIVSSPAQLFTLDLHTITVEECNQISANFCLTSLGSCDVFGFCLWFQTFFPADVDLNTSPFCMPTHWMQTMLYVPPFRVEQGSATSGSITFIRHPNHKRMIAIDLNYEYTSGDGEKKMNELKFMEMTEV